MKVHERHLWAAEKLEVQPADILLEIGCGPGVTASLVVEKLDTGELHLLDRSEKSVHKALKKTEAYIKKGTVKPIVGAFGKADLPSSHYDKVYCFNVRLLMEDNPKELSLVKELIGTNGLFYLFFQPPYHLPDTMTGQAKKNLEKNGFEVVNSEVKPMSPGPSMCHIAKSKGR